MSACLPEVTFVIMLTREFVNDEGSWVFLLENFLRFQSFVVDIYMVQFWSWLKVFVDFLYPGRDNTEKFGKKGRTK